MSSFFDDNDEQDKQEQKLLEFYQVYSADVRRRLLSKNVPTINNVYDVLYPNTKEALLSKNKSNGITIDNSAESIRNALLAKIVEENISLEKFSENFRNSLLARNNLSQSATDLQQKTEDIRNGLLSKNNSSQGESIDDVADAKRRELLSKNKESLDFQNNIERNNESFRENNVHKNVNNESDLEKDSSDFRKNLISKNKPSESDLLTDSNNFRSDELVLNTKNVSDLLNDSEQARKNGLASNKPSESDLLNDSEQARNSGLASNTKNVSDLLSDSEQARKNGLASNKPSESDLLKDSEQARNSGLANNTTNVSDLVKDSEQTRLDVLSKNKPSKSDILNDSEQTRTDVLSKNKPSESDLLSDSEQARKNGLASNTKNVSDLLSDSEQARKNGLASNTPSESNLLNDSEQTRTDVVSKNKPNESNLLNDSEQTRTDVVSKNKPSKSDILNDSEQTRKDVLSLNVPSTSDLLSLSEDPRAGLIAANKPNPTDLLSLSEDPRTSLLSANVPSPTDLLTLSEDPRTNLLSANVPDAGDLLNDSNPYYQNNLSANVPGKYDIDNFINIGGGVDSADQELKNLKSKNVPTNNTIDKFINNVGIRDSAASELKSLLSENVPTDNTIDKFINIAGAKDSAVNELKGLISKNTPSNYTVDNFINNAGGKDSASAERNSLISKNVAGSGDLLHDSKAYRDNLLAMNPNADLGVTFTGLGTATFLGVSKVLTQGLIIRSYLKSKNKPNTKLTFDNVNKGLRQYNVIHSTSHSWRNAYSIDGTGLNEYTQGRDSFGLTEKIYLAGTEYKDMVTQTGTKVADEIQKMFDVNSTSTSQAAIQSQYGISDRDRFVYNMGGGFFGVNSKNPQGGSFVSGSKAGKSIIVTDYSEGLTTLSIRNYNVSRNLYNIRGIQVGSTSAYIEDLKRNNDLGFQDLIAKTIGKFHNFTDSVGTQNFGVASFGISSGLYLGESAEERLRPGQGSVSPGEKNEWINSAKGAMAKTVAGNVLDGVEFIQGQRGVRKIINTIKNNKDSTIDFSQNFNTQEATKFIIRKAGTGKQEYSRQRFTIANPYGDLSVQKAKGLTFSLKNYSSGDSFYFPPYIESYNDSHTANWNEINFLGRPEPIYTYNNSNRDGSITFIVLTDYTQNFLIGSKYNTPQGVVEPIAVKAENHFTSADAIQNQARQESLGESNLQLRDNKDGQNAIAKKDEAASTNSKNVSTDAKVGPTGTKNGETANSTSDLETLKKESAAILKQQNDLLIAGNSGTKYNVTNSKGKNVYFQNTSNPSSKEGQYIDTTAGDTETRIKDMVSNLMFQPAYFSGDKIDFLRKMDFLAKLTKPARAQKGSGFSFTRPPVAHIKLGDWWDHDIVVKSVSVDYKESPWTLDEGGRVQPMWASVTLNFNFVGPYGGESGGPVVSTDVGGIYNHRG